MVNISRKKISEKILLAINNNLIKHISNLRKNNDTSEFINELFSSSEKIMLAKRFAVIFMLERGTGYQTIEKNLKVSPATISNIDSKRKNGDFEFIVAQMPKKGSVSKKKSNSSFWDDLEVILNFGMPPMSKGRWKHVFDTWDKSEELHCRMKKKIKKQIKNKRKREA